MGSMAMGGSGYDPTGSGMTPPMGPMTMGGMTSPYAQMSGMTPYGQQMPMSGGMGGVRGLGSPSGSNQWNPSGHGMAMAPSSGMAMSGTGGMGMPMAMGNRPDYGFGPGMGNPPQGLGRGSNQGTYQQYGTNGQPVP